MIDSLKLFSTEECEIILKKLDSIDDFFLLSSENFYVAGYPFYINKKVYEENEIKHKYNEVFNNIFKDEFAVMTKVFEEYLGANVYTHPDLAMPGFHKVIGESYSKSLVNFHFDDFKQFSHGLYPELGFTNSTQYNFTIQLTNNVKGSSGLSFYSVKLSKKLNIISATKTEVANLDSGLINNVHYERGSINVHKNLMHSIFFENNSPSEAQRITLQGVLKQTEKGYLIFW
jgi:hypothetical protein